MGTVKRIIKMFQKPLTLLFLTCVYSMKSRSITPIEYNKEKNAV